MDDSSRKCENGLDGTRQRKSGKLTCKMFSTGGKASADHGLLCEENAYTLDHAANTTRWVRAPGLLHTKGRKFLAFPTDKFATNVGHSA